MTPMRRLLCLTLLCLTLSAGLAVAQTGAAPATTAPPPKPTAVLIENVRVFDGRSERLSAPSNVLIVGNKIHSISAAPISPPSEATLTRVAGEGRTLMPGLIDNHVHIVMTASTMAQMSDPGARFEQIEARGAEEARQTLLRGFTTVRDLGGPVFGIKKSIDDGLAVGLRIYPSGAMISQTSGHGDSRLPSERSRRFFGKPSLGEEMGFSFIADGRDEVLTATRENLRYGATQIKVHAGGGAATAYDPLDVTQYTLDELKAAVEAADDWNTYVTVHAYNAKSVRRSVEAGVKVIEHGQLLDEATVKLLWGTDFLFNPEQNKNQNKDIPKLRQWFTPAEVLKLVTYDNAQVFQLSGPRNPYPGKLGVVEPGAYADLLLVDGDPLANLDLVADPAKNFVLIMKDGRIYKNLLQP